MVKTKFYAVKEGRNKGIYNTWEECKKEVSGYKGAIYKSFSTYKEAQDFIDGVESSYEIINASYDKAIAYVDGSYNIVTKEFSYGAVIFYKGQKYEFSQKFNNENRDLRNIAGELEGAKMAIKFCLDNNIPEVDINYDCLGIEKWAEGAWKVKKQATKEYKEYYDSASRNVKINFIKVNAHTNNKYNDIVDKLAKKALGIPCTSL